MCLLDCACKANVNLSPLQKLHISDTYIHVGDAVIPVYGRTVCQTNSLALQTGRQIVRLTPSFGIQCFAAAFVIQLQLDMIFLRTEKTASTDEQRR